MTISIDNRFLNPSSFFSPFPPSLTVTVAKSTNIATFTWTAPNDGGSSITNYKLKIKNLTDTVEYPLDNQLSYTIQFSPALTNTERTASVAAINSLGTGEYSDAESFHIGCKRGRSDINGQCTVCIAGQYEDQGQCVPCPVGTSTNNKRGVVMCPTCPIGYFSRFTGQYECTACAPGSTSNSDHTGCEECPAGYYSWAFGSSCQECPGQTTVGSNTCVKN
eukprot:TRINITY_DN4574_c0_g1_i3.p1 TRINITY_DN4574_c0_g1~~TRINITY_DN4574_c0_g1_i3.p1  ORF type:complete len:228 (-),score=24.66 TRINITY_DN4574_c0_g1_i3:117-776(-)